MSSEIKLEVRAALDVPGETRRQFHVFVLWFFCLLITVIAASSPWATVPRQVRGTKHEAASTQNSKQVRFKLALLLGLLLPGSITCLINHRWKRGGRHARGIIFDITEAGELRVWGRGYGQRLTLSGATTTESLVAVYAGRMGAWTQLRLRVEPDRGPSLEIATPATDADQNISDAIRGVEGDCVEVGRKDYDKLRALILALSKQDGDSTRDS